MYLNFSYESYFYVVLRFPLSQQLTTLVFAFNFLAALLRNYFVLHTPSDYMSHATFSGKLLCRIYCPLKFFAIY